LANEEEEANEDKQVWKVKRSTSGRMDVMGSESRRNKGECLAKNRVKSKSNERVEIIIKRKASTLKRVVLIRRSGVVNMEQKLKESKRRSV
jgi:hypothetical protein